MDGKDPKQRATAVPLGRMTRSEPTGWSVLVDRLATRVESARARELVEEAVSRSGRNNAPDDPDELLAFARAHLIDDLVSAIGAREVSAFLDDLREAARTISGVRRQDHELARGVVVLVDRDRLRRSGTARLLLARKLEVVVASKLDDLLATPLRPEVLVLEHDEALSAALLVMLSQPRFSPAIVVRTQLPDAARGMLERAGVERFELVTTTVPSDVVTAVESVLRWM